MTVAAEFLGGAAPGLEQRRARIAIAEAAEVLAAICRDQRALPSAVAAAERRVSDAFAHYGGLMMLAAARPRPHP